MRTTSENNGIVQPDHMVVFLRDERGKKLRAEYNEGVQAAPSVVSSRYPLSHSSLDFLRL
jgi:hypothetical protein